MTDVLNALVERIPYVGFLGVAFERHGDELWGRMPFRDRLVGNPMLPALHGGATGAFLEITAIMTLAWNRLNETGPPADGTMPPYPKPIDISIDYLRSGKPRDSLACATIMRHGRRIANVRVEAWQEDRARPIASAHGNFLMTAVRNP